MGKIEITGIDLVKFVKKVYDLSRPQGMGFLHYQEGGLSDEEAKVIVASGTHMDYVRGRSCKMNVFNENGKLFINSPWFDHSDVELLALLIHVGITATPDEEKHTVSCTCPKCRNR